MALQRPPQLSMCPWYREVSFSLQVPSHRRHPWLEPARREFGQTKKAISHKQGSLHYTPEHCLVNGGFPLFWWKKSCSHGQNVSFKEPCIKGLDFGICKKGNPTTRCCANISFRTTTQKEVSNVGKHNQPVEVALTRLKIEMQLARKGQESACQCKP